MVVAQLRAKLERNLEAAGVFGSVARGSAEKYSDVDLLLIVKRLRSAVGNVFILDDTYCSVNQKTFDGALVEMGVPTDFLPEILGGYSRILPIYDPRGLLPKLEERSAAIPHEIFRQSAQMTLLHSYEDFCRAKNAFLDGDDIVLKDCVDGITHSAALMVASLNHAEFESDRQIFKAHKRFQKLPKRFDRIARLRYGNLERKALFGTLLEFYVELVKFGRRQGLTFPVHESSLRQP
jgi:predicted nucleotidyltransferase